MRTTSKYVLATAIGAFGIFALLLATKIIPHGGLWLVTIVASVFAYWVCTRMGWLALVFVPFFPFLVFMLELDQADTESPSFGIAIAVWLLFALSAIAGALRWWKRSRNTAPSRQ